MNKREENEINIGFLFQALLKHIWVIILSAVVCCASMFTYSNFFVTPMYTATAQMYVNNLAIDYTHGSYISTTEIEAAKDLVNTYVTILKTPETLRLVAEKSGLSYTPGQLNSMISAGSVNETEIFYITVTAESAEEAADIANKITDVLPDRVSNIIKGSDVRLVQPAEVPVAPSTPNVVKSSILGAFFGIFISSAVIVIIKMVDNKIHDDDYPSETYGIHTLASIPEVEEHSEGGTRKKKRFAFSGSSIDFSNRAAPVLCDKLPFRVAEAYKMLRTNIFKISEKRGLPCMVIGVSSSNAAEGKSTLSTNIAYTLAQANKRVLLIEGDLRKPVLAKRLSVSPAVGLSDMIDGARKGAIQPSGYFDNWDVICAGKSVEDPSEMLSSHEMEVLVSELRADYEYIIIDLPPVNEVTDAIAVSGCLNGMVLAVRQNLTTKLDLETAMRHLSFSGTELFGFVITASRTDTKSQRYGHYYSYYSRKSTAENVPADAASEEKK